MYNAQASVDVETMLVVGHHLSQKPNDKKELTPAIEELEDLPKELGRVDTLLADAGYFSEANVKKCRAKQILPLISTNRVKHHQTRTIFRAGPFA